MFTVDHKSPHLVLQYTPPTIHTVHKRIVRIFPSPLSLPVRKALMQTTSMKPPIAHPLSTHDPTDHHHHHHHHISRPTTIRPTTKIPATIVTNGTTMAARNPGTTTSSLILSHRISQNIRNDARILGHTKTKIVTTQRIRTVETANGFSSPPTKVTNCRPGMVSALFKSDRQTHRRLATTICSVITRLS